MDIIEWLQYFFAYKDALPPRDQIPGMLFSPLHLAFAAALVVLIAIATFLLCKQKETFIRKFFAIQWIILVIYEIVKLAWQIYHSYPNPELYGILPLYPCNIYLYAMPFAIWGNGKVRQSACGYVCTLGLLGGLINFVYPANVLGEYSCLSFAGLHTFVYHGSIVLCAMVMLFSGYHRYTRITRWQELLLPSVPFLVVSVAANLVNFSPIDSDYMFFRLNSFIFAPIGAATPDWLSVLIVYGAYLLIHALPYLPSYISNRLKAEKAGA